MNDQTDRKFVNICEYLANCFYYDSLVIIKCKNNLIAFQAHSKLFSKSLVRNRGSNIQRKFEMISSFDLFQVQQAIQADSIAENIIFIAVQVSAIFQLSDVSRDFLCKVVDHTRGD